jgi:hypothetical protein
VLETPADVPMDVDMEPVPVAWDAVTGKPTKHGLRPKKADAGKAPEIKNFGNELAADWRERDPVTGVWRKVKMADEKEAAAASAPVGGAVVSRRDQWKTAK